MPNYHQKLDEILDIHEMFSPIRHIKKHELIKGDASKTFEVWLSDILMQLYLISMAIFDMDLYQPTKDVLEKSFQDLLKVQYSFLMR